MAGCGEYDDWANFPTTMAMRTSAEQAVMMSAKEGERFMYNAYRMRLKIPVSFIGEITSKARGYRLIDKDCRKKRIEKKGFLHF